MTCPHCAATTTTELTKRTQLGYRTFRCAACRRQFNERTGTPYTSLEFPTDRYCHINSRGGHVFGETRERAASCTVSHLYYAAG